MQQDSWPTHQAVSAVMSPIVSLHHQCGEQTARGITHIVIHNFFLFWDQQVTSNNFLHSILAHAIQSNNLGVALKVRKC